MKTRNHLLTAALLAACGVASFGPLRAAEKTSDSTWRSQKTTTTTTSGSLGQLEKASKLKGMEVLTSDNQKFGKVEDTVVDLQSEHILYAIVGSGGILGAGEKKYAIAPGAFTEISGDNVRLNVDKAKASGAPEFNKDVDKDTELGKTSFVNNLYQYFGQPAWWQGKTPASATSGQFNNVHKTSDLIGMKVKNVGNQDMGKVEDLMLSLRQGRIAFVILNPDSSLNLGDNFYALPSDTFTPSADGKFLSSDISKDKLTSAPHFAKNNWNELSDPSFASRVYQYYGKQAWFDQGNLRPTGRTDTDTKP